MIKIQKREECCGCSACQQICPQKCISLLPDNEGFLYPHVNLQKCVDCRLCEKVCPVLNQEDERKPIEVYAAYNRNEDIRIKSSSGGIFTLIAEEIINMNGVVFGVRWNSDWEAIFDYTTKVEDLRLFRGSKYVQAKLDNTFHLVEKFLKDEKKVLFTGTPCQIAGLRKFLRRDYPNLLLMDLICEGVPSPKVWKKYLEEELCLHNKSSQSQTTNKKSLYIIDNISFRDKGNGWKNYGIIIFGHYESELTKSNITLGRESPYLQALFYNLHLRPICYSCPFKQCKSYSDITIADYWGIHINHPEMDDNKGTSMVFLNTTKGISHFPLNKTIYLKTRYEENFYFNNIITSARKHKNRDKFYAKIDKCKSIKKLLKKCTFPLSYRIMETTKYVLSKTISKKNYHKLEAIWRKAKKS